jgi:hypothetical protein
MPKKKKASFFDDDKEESSSSDSSFPPGQNDSVPAFIPPPNSSPFQNQSNFQNPINQNIPPQSNFPNQGQGTIHQTNQQAGPVDQMTMLTQMMTTFQSMLSAGAMPQQWSSSTPFQQSEEMQEAIPHDIILPKTLERGIIAQKGLDVHPLYSKLFLTHENELLNGLPMGCTITLTGPAYSGKTRSALEMMINAVMKGIKTAYVVAEEGFFDTKGSGRNDLFSRFLQIAVEITGMSESEFRDKCDDLYVIIPAQYHLGKTWGDFIKDYRYVIEDLGCKFTIIDSINMLDPSKLNTVDNLNALKTYCHEKGVTSVVIGQVKDTGLPQGGEALFHTSEVSLHIYEKSMTSKAEAETWGSEYRQSIFLIEARSKVCHTVGFPIKINMHYKGLIRADENQPNKNDFPTGFWDKD